MESAEYKKEVEKVKELGSANFAEGKRRLPEPTRFGRIDEPQ